MHRTINSHVEALKIGRQIAEQVLGSYRRLGDTSSGKWEWESRLLHRRGNLNTSYKQIFLFFNR